MKAKFQNGFFTHESEGLAPINARYVVSITIKPNFKANEGAHSLLFLLFNGNVIEWVYGSQEKAKQAQKDLFFEPLSPENMGVHFFEILKTMDEAAAEEMRNKFKPNQNFEA
jgi:hypothetical protein